MPNTALYSPAHSVAVARAIGLVERVDQAKGVAYPFQGTIATTDGERMSGW